MTKLPQHKALQESRSALHQAALRVGATAFTSANDVAAFDVLFCATTLDKVKAVRTRSEEYILAIIIVDVYGFLSPMNFY